MSKNFSENIRVAGGISLEYSALTEVDFTAAAGGVYNPPEVGNFRRLNTTRTLQLLQDITGVVETFQTSAAEVRLPANTIADLTNDAGNGRLIFLKNSGTGNITVKDYLGNVLWTVLENGITIVVGNDNDNWDFYFRAVNIPFDNLTNGFVAENTQKAIEESRSKAGSIINTAFTGSPKKATVVFSPSFPNTNYAVVISGIDTRSWSVENKTVTGFTVNTNANQGITDLVFWNATLNWG